MGSPSRNVQYHPPRLSEDRLNLPQPHSPSLPTHCSGKSGLLALHGMQDAIESQRLFPRSRAERITEALSQQAHRFAHRNESLTNDSTPPGRRNGELQT